MQSTFQEYEFQNQNKTFIYTDGSKQGDKVGFGMAAAHLDYGKRLPDKLSIFTAEATAHLAAVKICVLQKRDNEVICSDSKSVLQALRKCTTQHAISLHRFKKKSRQNKTSPSSGSRDTPVSRETRSQTR